MATLSQKYLKAWSRHWGHFIHGAYADEEIGEMEVVQDTAKENSDKQARPGYGHAKNKRTDLKQMVINLATTGSAGYPIWMDAHSGHAVIR